MSFDHDDIWINAPIWLRKAYLNDTVVNAAMKEAVMEGFNERDTLLLVIKGLLFRDQLRLDQIGELQASARNCELLDE